jgi:hypothetical protein
MGKEEKAERRGRNMSENGVRRESRERSKRKELRKKKREEIFER